MAIPSVRNSRTRPTSAPRPNRAEQAALRRRAIVDAAIEEFLEKGFAATRVEDIARRAGVAKGTIYLNFKDKEALFAAIVQQEIRAKVDTASLGPLPQETLRAFADRVIVPLIGELVNSRRAAIIRLLIGEAGRFPKLAEVYFRLVVEPGLGGIRAMVQQASKRNELKDDMLLKFPHLLVAPVIFSVIWTGLFQEFSSLDVEAMLRAYYQHVLKCAEEERHRGERVRWSLK
ncbi:MAG: TetR/AcrR family transcriptional regulator [Bryobacteraceae bacterium]